MGLEYFGAAMLMGLAGYWIDRKYGTWPWAALIGLFSGFTGAMYLLIKEAMQANRQFAKQYKAEHTKAEKAEKPESKQPESKQDVTDETKLND